MSGFFYMIDTNGADAKKGSETAARHRDAMYGYADTQEASAAKNQSSSKL